MEITPLSDNPESPVIQLSALPQARKPTQFSEHCLIALANKNKLCITDFLENPVVIENLPKPSNLPGDRDFIPYIAWRGVAFDGMLQFRTTDLTASHRQF